MTADDNGHLRYSHIGGMPGVATVLNIYPAERLAVVVLTNASECCTIGRIAQEIAATVLPGYAETRRQTARPAPAVTPPPFKPTSELLGEWTGTIRTWAEDVPFTLVVEPDGDVHVRLGSEPRTRLNRVSRRS